MPSRNRHPGSTRARQSINVPQLLAHVAYLNTVLNFGWLNPVFWSLAIEFQYYLFVALIFPLLNSPKKRIRVTALMIIALIGLLGFGRQSLLPHWLPLFAIGIATFQVFVGHLTRLSYFVLISLIAAICCRVVGVQETGVGLFTAATIFIFGAKPMPKLFAPVAAAGTISYSLYLIHVPIGGRVINLAQRLPDTPLYRYPAILLAFVVTIGGAYVFWRIVENPSQRWAKAARSRSEFANGEVHSDLATGRNVLVADEESSVASR